MGGGAMVPLPLDRLPEFEAWLAARWNWPSWFVRRGALAVSFGLLGLRWSEVEVMRPGDLFEGTGTLYVRTRKRGRPRMIEGPQGLLAAARRMRAEVVGGEERVFVTARGRGMTYQDVRRFVESCTRRVFGRPFSFHCFRHTAAVRAYARTRDVLAVQRLLGHVSLQWTNSYLAALQVVDVGGPIAFAGGGEVGRPRLFDPDALGRRAVVRSVAARGKAAAGKDGEVFESDTAAGGGGRMRGHVCGEHFMPIKFGGQEGVVSVLCTKCGAVWQWNVGESAEKARKVKEGPRRSMLRTAAEIEEAVAEKESKRRSCMHERRERRKGRYGLAEYCLDCGAFYGYVRRRSGRKPR